VIIPAGLIWALIGAVYTSHGISDAAATALRHNLLEYGELLLFLLAAMTYINAMEERLVFEALRGWLVRRSLSYRALFWATSTLAFVISPVADNLTTALIMCAVLLAVGGHSHRCVTLGCINIVVAANAGGAFSLFGDITTPLVWQRGNVEFWTFYALFVPSLIDYMDPHMSTGQWLLVTLTAGVGGSLLSIGSAAGVALMGQSRGMYTFFGHLKWTPAIALGYALSIVAHLCVSAELM